LQKTSGVGALTALFLETLTVYIEKVTEPFIVIREWLCFLDDFLVNWNLVDGLEYGLEFRLNLGPL